jgi:hypothetical protein
MNDEKMRLFQQLDEARAYLWSVLELVEPEGMINPGWNKRDFYAHIGGWEAWVFEAFRNYVTGEAGRFRPFTSVDDSNRELVQARQSMPEEDAKLECEINRFAIKTLLQNIPIEEYRTPIPFPWGPDTVVGFFEEAIRHELGHAKEIVQMRQAG